MRSYSYDVRGNLIRTEVENLLDTAASYVSAYTYDADGNQIKESERVSGTETNSTYDPAGRLSGYIKRENGQVTLEQTNQYNGSGTRIQKAEDGDITNYFYSQGGVLYTEDGNGKGTSLNLQGRTGNVIATAREEAGVESYYYYHKNPNGSTTNLRDASGTSIVSYQYTDFGETSIYGDTDFYNEICYNGAIYDESTGLYYLSARYYDPEDGRFLTRDSYRGNATNSMTWHLYTYCANNPINYEDPSGHIAVSRIVGGIIGAAAGALAGSMIAKKTNATGWKKFAIIAGCTVAGGAVGALAGPKVAKQVASVADKVLTSKSSTYRTTKTTLSNVKSSVSKVVSKSKQLITKETKKVSNINTQIENFSSRSQNSTALQTYYPRNNGAFSKIESKFLMQGEKIDRFGKLSGKYFSPQATPMQMRALPPSADTSLYHVFEVIKPFEVETSVIAPAFGQIGLGIQYRSVVSVEVLLKRGIIKMIF